MGRPSLISGQKLLTGHRCWGRFSCVFHYLSTPILAVEWSTGRRRTRGFTHLYNTGTGTGRRVVHILNVIYTAVVAGALQENRQYFCRAKNGGGGGGSKTMWTPPLPSPLPPPHPGPASSTRSDGVFLLAGHPDGYARATPPHRRHPLHVARRHRAIPARGLLMFLGRTHILSEAEAAEYTPNTCYTYIIMTVFRKRSFRILYPSSVPTRPATHTPHSPQVNNSNTAHRYTSI